MEKLRVRYPVIVEGRYDKARLCSFLSGDIIQTDGFRLLSDKKKLALIRRLAQADKVVVLTDSDRAGFRIRGHIAGAVPPEKLIHVYIPQVPGKERRKARPSAEGTLGVEGMDAEVLREALEKAGALADSQPPERSPITKGDLYALGLSGGEGSAALRRRLLRRLDLPEGIGANALPGVLARLVTLEELAALTARLREEEEGSEEGNGTPSLIRYKDRGGLCYTGTGKLPPAGGTAGGAGAPPRRHRGGDPAALR